MTNPDPTEQIKDRTTALLSSLGDTAESIAQKLSELNIQGRPQHAESCPIARYLTRKGTDGRYEVEDEAVTVWISEGDVTEEFVIVPLEDPVSEFVTRYDGGDFDELDEDAS